MAKDIIFITSEQVIQAQQTVAALEKDIERLQSDLRQGNKEWTPGISDRIPEIVSRLRQFHLEKLQMEWTTLELGLTLAAQGGSSLMEHPGYRRFVPAECFPFPLELDDVSEAMLSLAQAHETALQHFAESFDEAITTVDGQLSIFEEQVRAVAQHGKKLDALREQRRQASAKGEDTTQLGVAMDETRTELDHGQKLIKQSEDDVSGLNLRRTELLKAKEATEAGLKVLELFTGVMDLCFLAKEYNRQATLTADAYRQFQAKEQTVQQTVHQLGLRHLQGVPKQHFTAIANLPQIRLNWLNSNGNGLLSSKSDFYHLMD